MHQQPSISQNQQPSLPSQKLFDIQGFRFIQLKIRTSGEQNLILLVRVDTITGSLKNMVIDRFVPSVYEIKQKGPSHYRRRI